MTSTSLLCLACDCELYRKTATSLTVVQFKNTHTVTQSDTHTNTVTHTVHTVIHRTYSLGIIDEGRYCFFVHARIWSV